MTEQRLTELKALYAGVRVIGPPPVQARNICRWCLEPIDESGRWRWHKACAKQWDQWQSPTWAAWRRDKGVCLDCGLHAHKLEKIHRRLKRIDREAALELAGHYGINPDTSFWEADHIVEISEGGGNWPENIRTLCQPCHRIRTAEFRARTAAKNKMLAEDSPFGRLKPDNIVTVTERCRNQEQGNYENVKYEGTVIKTTPTLLIVEWKAMWNWDKQGRFYRKDGKQQGNKRCWLEI